MAELTPLDEKLGEVLGLAQAAQAATDHVAKMEGADEFKAELERMHEQAAETERRTDALVDTLEGKKTAIREKARETKSEAAEMMKTYLADEEEALDGFEFLSMAEAGEVCHWEIVDKIAETVGDAKAAELARWAVPIQRGHLEVVREAYLELAVDEAEGDDDGLARLPVAAALRPQALHAGLRRGIARIGFARCPPPSGRPRFDVLRRLGLTTIFSNPGSTEVPFLAGLPEDLTFVLALHEGSVVAMASGHALGSGRPALALLHSTPGLGNAVAAIATARLNRTPLVVIVGQQDRRHLALEPFLAGRLDGLAGSYPVSSDQPVRAQDVPGAIVRAYHAAVTHRGPALVIVPMDDWSAPAPEPHEVLGPALLLRSHAADPIAVEALAGVLDASENPALVAGAGADGDDGWSGMVALAERLELPGLPRAVRRPGRFPAGPSAVRRAPARSPRAAARRARAATTPCSWSGPARSASTRTTPARW